MDVNSKLADAYYGYSFQDELEEALIIGSVLKLMKNWLNIQKILVLMFGMKMEI